MTTTAGGVVLVVDDEPINLVVAEAILATQGFDVHGVSRADDVIPSVRRLRPDVLLLDVMLPGRDGFDLCRSIRRDPYLALTPIVFMTALSDRRHRLEGLEAGADDFMTKPIDDVELLARVRALAQRNRLQARLSTTRAVIESLATLIEARDGSTGQHCRRLAHLAHAFGVSLGLGGEDLEALEWSGILHDIGKVGVPDAVLQKPGPLDRHEWEQMRRHVTIGEEIVAPLEGLSAVTPVVRSHHERWDGSGYPDGLAGEAIPYLARVFQIVDVYDALASERSYKPALAPAKALEVMAAEAGSTMDPMLFALFAADASLHREVSSDPELSPMLVPTPRKRDDATDRQGSPR